MAGSGSKVYDILAVVTQSSPATTSLRPTLAEETDATVANPAHAVDSDLDSYAELDDATSAALLLSVVSNTGRVSDAGRDWVELVVVGDFDTAAGSEFLSLEFRADGGNWNSVDSSAASSGNWDPAERTFDITSACASYKEADFEVRFTFFRAGGTGTFRVHDVRVEIGGDVVAPTAAEIEEDVAVLGAAKFDQWYDTLAVTIEAGLAEFGGTAAERTVLLDSVRDSVVALDAQALLPDSLARATAEAYEDVAVGAGSPRYPTGAE